MSQTRVEAFREWLLSANTGQTYIYFTGNLGGNRFVPTVDGTGTVIDCPNGDIDELGTLAYQAFTANRVHLWQRKLRDNEYQYIAMKRRDGGRIW